jgi:hypothetical protein
MSKKVFAALALCAALFSLASPAPAQSNEKTDQDVLTQLQREGWKIVKDGVLQRELVRGEVESFVFGVPGFVWKIQDLQRQLRKLRVEFRANPTPELRKALANHRKAIANAEKALAIARVAEDSGKDIDLSKVSCAINFTYDASATKNPSAAGVLANASATFNANCGFTGQVYAYAFAKTTVNGAETTDTVTDGPRSGANVSATASASRNGGAPCESYAYGEMISSGLNPSSWSKSATNYDCTYAPPLNVAVTSNAASTTIDLYNSDCVTITWTTSISGGTSPYTSTMFLNSASQGTRTTYSKSYCNAGTNTSVTAAVSSTVTDSSSPVQSKSASAPTITIRSHTVVSSPTVTINGPTYLGVDTCTTYTWTASVSGGTSPYTYQWTWNGTAVGTGSSYSRQYCPGINYTYTTHTVGLTVTDSGSRTGTASKTVNVERFGDGGGGCGPNPCP